MTINLDQYTNTLNVTDTATNADLNVTTKGTGNHVFNSGNGTQFRIVNANSSVNYFQTNGAATGGQPGFRVDGSDTNISTAFTTKGTGSHFFLTNGFSQTQFVVTHTASAVNYVQVTGASTGNSPAISAQGSDTNIQIQLQAKGTGLVRFTTGGGLQAYVSDTVSAVNYVQLSGAATGGGVVVGSQGSDATVNINYWAKGSGAHIFATGSYLPQFIVTHTASAVNYVQVSGAATGNRVSIAGAGSDANVGIDYIARGTSPHVFLTNGVAQFLISNTTSAVNYVQVTGAATGGNPTISSQGSDTNINLVLSPKASAVVAVSSELRVATAAVNFFQMYGSGSGSGPVFASIGSDTNIDLNLTTKGTGFIKFQNAYGTQAQIGTTYTINSTAFPSITGTPFGQAIYGSTGSTVITAAGTNSIAIQTTSTAFTQVLVTNTTSAVNYHSFTGAVTGFGPVHTVAGSDTNIPLVLQPKGTGALQAQQTDSTATGGNARGANAVDWSTARATAAQVASGQWSTISGGVSNTVSATASNIGGGATNAVSNTYSGIFGGQNNTNTATYSFIGGGSSNTTGTNAYQNIVGGKSNTASGVFNFIGGGFTNSGTSSSAVTTQSGTMNATTAVTLSGSNANIKVGQYISGTSIGDDTYVAAISGTSLTLSKVASGSSTSTLSFFTPHGVVVGGGNNTATGSYSFIGGGGDAGTAGNRNVASGDWSFVGGGRKNVASGIGSTVAGGGTDGGSIFSNIASGTLSTVSGGWNNVAGGTIATVSGGQTNNANGTAATITGGSDNVATGSYATVVGGQLGWTRSINGNVVFSPCAQPIAFGSGLSQTALLVLARQTTDATPTVLRSDTGAASTTNQVILPNNSAYFFTGEVVAGVTGGGNTKGWTIEGVIKRGANAAATTLVGSTVTSTYGDVGASTWAIAVTADTTNGGLAVTFTGQASTTIRTVCQVRTTEMTF